jgi:hypothetical protein
MPSRRRNRADRKDERAVQAGIMKIGCSYADGCNHCYADAPRHTAIRHYADYALRRCRMYSYQTEKSKLFTEEGQVLFMAIRDNTKYLLSKSGAVRMSEAISGNSGDSWTKLACIDRMVELGELLEITMPNSCAGQRRVFVSGNA